MNYLIQMAGFPGSGKSTLSKQIAKEFGAIVLDRDVIKNAMLSVGIENQWLNEGSYKVVFDLAEYFLKQNLNIIIDTPCFYESIILQGKDICNRTHSKYKYIECIVEDYQRVNKRLSSRNKLKTQIGETTEELYYKSYKQSQKPTDAFLSLDTSDLSNVDFEAIGQYLNC